MNLTDLREELAARAAESDDRPADLLAATHRRIVRVKRRRIAGAVAGAAAAAAVGLGLLLPGTGANSVPDPAVTPRTDYVENGIRIPARLGPDQLDAAATGTVGQNALELKWTPTSHQFAFSTFCRGATLALVEVRVNGQEVATRGCDNESDELDRQHSTDLRADDTLWLTTPLGRSAKVTVALVDEIGQRVTEPAVQLAVGVYRNGGGRTGPPTRVPPAGPDDYVMDGVRYRAKVAGDTLAAAVVGEPGQSTAKVRFPFAGGELRFRDFCNLPSDDPRYNVSVAVNGIQVSSLGSCSSSSIDAGSGGSFAIAGESRGLVPGSAAEATVTLTDKQGRPVTVPGARLGLGIYRPGPQRKIDGGPGGGTITLPELNEHGGFVYRLTDLRTMDAGQAAEAPATKRFSIPTPAGVPFLVSYGGSDVGAAVRLSLNGVSTGTGISSAQTTVGVGTEAEGARPAGVARLTVEEGRPTRGKLVLAVYTLQR